MTEEEYNNLQYDIEQAQLSNIEKKKKEIAEKKKRRAEYDKDRGRRGGSKEDQGDLKYEIERAKREKRMGGSRRSRRRDDNDRLGRNRRSRSRSKTRSRSRGKSRDKSRRSKRRSRSKSRSRSRSRSKGKKSTERYRRYYDESEGEKRNGDSGEKHKGRNKIKKESGHGSGGSD